MKTELRISDHSVTPGQKVVELWYHGRLIGQVVGADGPGVRILSKHEMVPVRRDPIVIDVFIKDPVATELEALFKWADEHREELGGLV